jgi:hypothetical protein
MPAPVELTPEPSMTKEEIRRFQDRWMRPAGIAAMVGALLIAISLAMGRIGIPSPDNSAEQLLNYQDHASQLELAAVLSSLGLLCFAIPLHFLFRSAHYRSERMRGFVGAFVILGPVFIAIQGTLLSFALNDASDGVAAKLPSVEAKAKQAAVQGAPARNDNVSTVTTAETQTTTTTTTTPKGTTTTKTTTETIPKGACTKSVDDCVDDARDNLVDDEVRDTSLYTPAQITGLFGSLALIGGGIYTLIWTMRTGLLTRFMATVGMIFIASLLLIPQLGPFGLVLWFAILGLILNGWWARPPPPAWEAAEAIPWPRAGEDIGPPVERPPSGTVEGSGREVSEAPLPDESADGPTLSGSQGERRKKRKRRK